MQIEEPSDQQTTGQPQHYQVADVIKQAKQLNMLAALAIPHVMLFLFPPMFIYFWERCRELVTQERGFPKLALGIPRGHAKTAFLKLLILYIILFTKRKFILVICASEDLAENIVGDVIDMLDHNNIRKVFGNWDEDVETNRNGHKSFTFRGRSIIFKGVGQGTSFRGIQEKFARPDVMIFDDAQTKECAMSQAQAKQFASWFRGTAMKAKDPKFCFFLYVGNIYPKYEMQPADPSRGIPAIFGCMLKNLKMSKYWESIVVGAILSDGTALWEELQSREQLLKEFQEDQEAGEEATFLAEVMNDDEAIDTNMFDETKVPDIVWPVDTQGEGEFLIIDPSLGKSKSDEQIVGHVKVIDGLAILWELRRYQVSAPKLVQCVIDWCLSDNIPCVAIENYAYQASLGDWFEDIMADDGLTSMDGMSAIEGINTVLINKGSQSKNSAIQSMFKEVMDGDLGIHPKAKAMLYSEIKTFDPLSRNNKDNCLDVATYANAVKLKFPDEIRVNILLFHQEYYDNQNGEVVDVGMNY